MGLTQKELAVSIHAPARGATVSQLHWQQPDGCFNPRPRAGGDHDQTGCAVLLIGFNPRPRAGGDPRSSAGGRMDRLVSIHAPARGATEIDARTCRRYQEFQSTPPRGGRPARLVLLQTPFRVSIHAPARGATAERVPRQGLQYCFNPRPRAGGDQRRDVVVARAKRFQSTPPRGGRPASGPC